jgi:hypothetical protein
VATSRANPRRQQLALFMIDHQRSDACDLLEHGIKYRRQDDRNQAAGNLIRSALSS